MENKKPKVDFSRIEIVYSYKTKDGKIFNNINDALKHDAFLFEFGKIEDIVNFCVSLVDDKISQDFTNRSQSKRIVEINQQFSILRHQLLVEDYNYLTMMVKFFHQIYK